MAELVKPWNDGGSLSVTYDGDGDGSAVFSSDTNEGIDREMSVSFKGGGLSVERTVKQEGKRLRFRCKDGLFILRDGGTFNVLKTKPKKIVNQIRLAFVGNLLLGKIANADDTSLLPSFDYAVTSDVSLIFRMMKDGEDYDYVVHIFSEGEKGLAVTKFVPLGEVFLSARCEPKEDDNYIYKVTVTDLRS